MKKTSRVEQKHSLCFFQKLHELSESVFYLTKEAFRLHLVFASTYYSDKASSIGFNDDRLNADVHPFFPVRGCAFASDSEAEKRDVHIYDATDSPCRSARIGNFSMTRLGFLPENNS